MSNEEGNSEDFAKQMAEHGFSGLEQLVGVENGELVKRFNELRMTDAKAEIRKTEAEADLNEGKAHVLTAVLLLAIVVILFVLAVCVPVAVMVWKAGF